jgi:tRNA threonylcarbamoyladenosine biosynthesis protein TsaB
VRILAFDTATRATAVALVAGGETVELRDLPRAGERPNHATHLLPLIVQVMGSAGVGWEQVDRIAVGLGPGTFTGLRIGVATARALARATGIPLVGVSTLQALAQNLRLAPADALGSADSADVVATVLDARRGEVYAAAWDATRTDAAPLLRPAAVPPEALPDLLSALGSRPLAIGEGAIAFREVLERGGLSVPDDDSDLHLVRASGHGLLAPGLTASDIDALVPDYQRLPDVQPRSATAQTEQSAPRADRPTR